MSRPQNVPADMSRVDSLRLLVDMNDNTPSSETLARLRRIVGLLHDVGLLEVVGRDWVTVTDGRLEFGALEGRAAQEWVRILDDLATRLPDKEPPVPGPGQALLPFPIRTPHHLRHHLAVAR